VHLHRCDADPDPDFHVDADPHADPTTSFTHVEKSEYFNHCISSLKCFVFLISDVSECFFPFMDTILKFSGKSLVYQLFHLFGIDPDPAK
jgi:hypothetical protein